MLHNEYIRHTDGDTAVLFIHGFLGGPKHFERFVELVPSEYGVYNVFLHGHGKTVKDFSSSSMNIWKAQVEAVFLMLKERYGKVIITAHSMGTLFAYSMAIKYPDAVKSLFLLGSPLVIQVRGTVFLNSFKVLLGLVSEDDAMGKAYARSNSIKLNFRLWEYVGWFPRYLELREEAVNSRKKLLKVTVPCYVFQSANDEMVSRKSEKYIRRNKNIILTVLEKSSHFIYDEDDMSLLCKKFKELM